MEGLGEEEGEGEREGDIRGGIMPGERGEGEDLVPSLPPSWHLKNSWNSPILLYCFLLG